MKTLNIAVIGVGSISEAHISAYQKHPAVRLLAFCDINDAVLEAKGKKHNVTKLYSDYNVMLKELPELDAVSVCAWNSEHAPISIAALNAGKHVLCEKPMATNAADAARMVAAAKKNGKRLMIGFVRRFGNDCAIVRDFVQNGSLGEIYYAKASYIRRNGFPGGWFGDLKRAGGGPMFDLGVHVIDLVRYLMGNPKPVSVYGVTFSKLAGGRALKSRAQYQSVSTQGAGEVFDVEDFAAALIRFDNGAALNVETSFALNVKTDEGKIELFGTKGGVRLDPEFEFYSAINGYPANIKLATPTALSFLDLFDNEIHHFVDCLLSGAEFRAPMEDGAEIMRILSAVYESAASGREVSLL
ncbi:MAG: Gfo/Idh/MocA family oxidoreductase [Clostridiales bacterium]|jgi:predicted dehydrogenase|nr:Gfo/Idh/MocA family oxidoreductase [Clostridiales bacterium]